MVDFIKICGIKTLQELRIVEKFADATGVVINSPSPRSISLDKAKSIIEISRIPVFLVSTMRSVEEWGHAIEYTGARYIQIHGDLTPEDIEKLKNGYGVFVMKTFLVPRNSHKPQQDAENIIRRIEVYSVNLHLLDTGAGTGLGHDLRVSRIVASKFPIVIAGGLNPENVRDVVKFVRPYGVDVSSGVELNGVKNCKLVEKFVRVVRNV